jgi:hypothetical protein
MILFVPPLHAMAANKLNRTRVGEQMSIQADLDELSNLNIEISRLQDTLRVYRNQKKRVEERVIAFLKEQETHGVRYNNQAVLLETKNFRNKKRKADKIQDLAGVLRRHGITNPDGILRDILEAQRGNESANDVLRLVRR